MSSLYEEQYIFYGYVFAEDFEIVVLQTEMVQITLNINGMVETLW